MSAPHLAKLVSQLTECRNGGDDQGHENAWCQGVRSSAPENQATSAREVPPIRLSAPFDSLRSLRVGSSPRNKPPGRRTLDGGQGADDSIGSGRKEGYRNSLTISWCS